MMNLATVRSDAQLGLHEDAICVAVAIALGAANSGLERIMVASQSGCIVLTGRLNSYYVKQLAQTVAKTVSGVGLVKNDILVQTH